MTNSVSKNRAALLMIAGIPIIIILTATWLWYFVASGKIDLVAMLGTANRGQLLSPPLALDELAATTADGTLVKVTDSEQPVWRILVPGSAACDEECQQVLYYTRQIHTAMGKYKGRIERVYLADEAALGSPATQRLPEDYEGLKVLYTAPSKLAALRSAVADGPAAAYFVVDPYGWIILSYLPGADGKDVMADLKFLLKNSNG